MSIKRVHIFYAGWVQGVSFRATSCQVAHQIGGLTGWVRNLSDGRVEILCEGEEERLEEFITNVHREMQTHISSEEISWHKASGELLNFDVRL